MDNKFHPKTPCTLPDFHPPPLPFNPFALQFGSINECTERWVCIFLYTCHDSLFPCIHNVSRVQGSRLFYLNDVLMRAHTSYITPPDIYSDPLPSTKSRTLALPHLPPHTFALSPIVTFPTQLTFLMVLRVQHPALIPHDSRLVCWNQTASTLQG